MSQSTARAISMALLGGIAAAFFPFLALFYWAGLLAWGCFLAAGGTGAALVTSLAGNILGAFLGWAALLIMFLIHIPSGSWLWVPRAGLSVGATLLALGLLARVRTFSHVPSGLAGYASVIAAVYYVRIADLPILGRMTGLHMYNPFIAVVLSMTLGGVLAWIAVKLAEAMTRD